MYIVPSRLQTSQWRRAQSWYINGKHNECEKYQKRILDTIVGSNHLKKSNKRLHLSSYELIDNNDYCKFTVSENFDYETRLFLFNLKFICDKGGHQDRTLRNVYQFINCQLENKVLYPSDITFVNILDGDESYKNILHFMKLKSQQRYRNVSHQIFIGDMHTFLDYYIGY
jgi:hypothetical protein